MDQPASQHVLLLIGHGSRRTEANDALRALALRLEAALPQGQKVIAAYLEIASPSIQTAIETIVESGRLQIVVLPFFLSDGRHVTEDIPRILDEARLTYPDLVIDCLPHLGEDPLLFDALLERAKAL